MNKVLLARYPKRLTLVKRHAIKTKASRLSYTPLIYLQALLNICFISALYFLWDSVDVSRKDFVEDKVYVAKRHNKIDEQNEKVTEILKFLLRAKDNTETLKPESSGSSVREVAQVIGITNGPKANLRSAPSADSEIIMVLTGSNKLLIEGEEGSFYKVTAPSGEKAYVAKSLVNVPTDIG